MENNPEASRTSNDENVAEFMGKIMVAAILVVVFLTILFVCLQILFNRLFCRRRPITTTPRSRQLGTEHIPPQRGLNPNILKSLPVVIITPKLELKERLECAVRLSEFCEGQRARFLSKCRPDSADSAESPSHPPVSRHIIRVPASQVGYCLPRRTVCRYRNGLARSGYDSAESANHELSGVLILWFTLLGVQTPNCIRQTIFDAVALDYRKVTVIVDATAAATPDIHNECHGR